MLDSDNFVLVYENRQQLKVGCHSDHLSMRFHAWVVIFRLACQQLFYASGKLMNGKNLQDPFSTFMLLSNVKIAQR